MATATASKVIQHIRKLAAAENRYHQPDSELLERFVDRQEDPAFQALVRRHGPLVLGVCRRVLRHEQDAEDAFQATFLVLARKARSIGKKDSLSSWLYKVAYRAALKARAQAATRRKNEKSLKESGPGDPLDELTGRELLAVLDEEMHRLPERFRAPLVHCYLQGQTRDQAARQLGWSLSTLQRRLEEGRERLRARLERRGVAISIGFLVAGVTQGASATTLPSVLVGGTVKAAMMAVAGKAVAAGAISAAGLSLANSILRPMVTAKLKMAVVLLLAAGLIGAGIGMATQQVLGQRQRAANPSADRESPPKASKESLPPGQSAQAENKRSSTPPSQKTEPDVKKEMTVTGRVLDPEGKPVAGAQVAVTANPDEILGRTKTDGDGQFRLRVRRTSSSREWAVNIIGAAAGYGLGWQSLQSDAERHEVVVRLHPEQVLRGRLIDFQGQGAAGVKTYLAYVAEKNARQAGESVGFSEPHENWSPWPGPVTTDKQGRFTLRGVGPDQRVGLHISDDRFARQTLHRIDSGNKENAKEVTLVLKPAQVVEGQVTYQDTGRPAARAQLIVRGVDREINRPTFEHGEVTAQADDQGRFRISSYPGNTLVVGVVPPEGTPYLVANKDLAWPKGVTKQKLDLALPRGALVRGKITELASGQPVAGAKVQFWPRIADNPNYRADVGNRGATSGPDGTFQIVVPPGPGNVVVRSSTPDFIQRGVYYDYSSGKLEDTPGDARRQSRVHWFLSGFVALDLKPGVEPAVVKVVLRRGVTVKGQLLAPDGKPVAKAQMLCELPVASSEYSGLRAVEVRDGRFELRGCDPEETYPVYFLDAQNQWGTVAEIPGKQPGADPVTVQLTPCGSAVARFVDPQGKPIPNYHLNPYGFELLVRPAFPTNRKAPDQAALNLEPVRLTELDRLHYGGWTDDAPATDAQGRIRLPALIPGATYRVSISTSKRGLQKEFMVEGGKTLDLPEFTIP